MAYVRWSTPVDKKKPWLMSALYIYGDVMGGVTCHFAARWRGKGGRWNYYKHPWAGKSINLPDEATMAAFVHNLRKTTKFHVPDWLVERLLNDAAAENGGWDELVR